MFGKFNEDAQKVLVRTKKEMLALKHPYIGSEHLVLGILKNKESQFVKKLNKYNITYKNSNKSFWPLLIILDIAVLIMVLGSIAWHKGFNVKLFENVYESIVNFEVFGFNIFGQLLGQIQLYKFMNICDSNVKI